MKEAISQMRSALNENSINEESFADNNKKVVFYTGLSTRCLLKTIFSFIKPYLRVGGNSTLSPFQQLIVTLIRLCLNLQIQDIGYIFSVHNSTISSTFLHVIDVLYVKFKPLNRWPDCHILRKIMSMAFRRHFPSCVETSIVLKSFWINPQVCLLGHKRILPINITILSSIYLIGVTPQSTVSFISNGWSGRTNDKYLTEHSTLYKCPLPGDTMLTLKK